MKDFTAKFCKNVIGAAVLVAALSGCSLFAPSVGIEYDFSPPFEDGSQEINVITLLKSDTIHYGSARIFSRRLSFKNEAGEEINFWVWLPAAPHHTAKLAVLIHGYGAPLEGMTPLAVSMIKKACR